MASNASIENLAEKLKLAMRSGVSDVVTESELIKRLGIGKDYLSRIKSGGRTVPEATLAKLCTIFKIEQSFWYLPVAQFGKKLGLSRYLTSAISGARLPGMDLNSRNIDPGRVAILFDILEGYWESYYYSVSKIGKILVSRDLLIVNGVTPDNFIECHIMDGQSKYAGWCFPIPNHLYFVLEKQILFNEIIVYATNLPERQPPRLYGVILCLSGGVDEHHSFPAAAKVAFRYLGKESDMRRLHKLKPDDDVQAFMEKRVPGYVDPKDTLDPEVREILDAISNVVMPATIPNALRMTK